jgi:2-isopropylmalate synthase
MARKITIFDTTLRDGEQSPGFSMNVSEKVQVARQLDRLGVDVIEGGFPVSSPDDFQAIQKMSQLVEKAEVCGLARTVEKDIKAVYEATKEAKFPKIHTFVATSPIHREFKLKKTKEEVLQIAVEGVKMARSYMSQVVFSPEDASRTETEFLHQVVRSAIQAGARVINIPDTVGYSTPEEFRELIQNLYEQVIQPWNQENQEEVIISTHCQNDLGLATANSLAGVVGGAREVQCTINGIGERGGNASLEEVVMALKTRQDFYETEVDINTQEIYPTSKLVTTVTGVPVQPNKAIVGANAFAHESGIHQDGILKNRETYEIMKPEDIGLQKNRLVLGKHSGRHAIKTKLEELGYVLNEEELQEFMEKFKALADKKKKVYDQDLHLLMQEENVETNSQELYQLQNLTIHCGSNKEAQAEVSLQVNSQREIQEKQKLWSKEKAQQQELKEGQLVTVACEGDGPVDAAYGAVNKILQVENILLEFSVNAVTEGIDAQATVNVRVQVGEQIYTASASNTDITIASVKAYLKALNEGLYRQK